MKLSLSYYDLPLRHMFTIAHGSTAVQRTLIVQLEQDGVCGYGEATTNPYYGATHQSMAAALDRVRPLVERYRLGDPAEFWELAHRELADDSFAHCALDIAAHDLWGKLRHAPVWELWGLSLDNLPVTDYTIGIDTVEMMVRKLEEFPDWPVYKIKLGTADDLQIVRQLRRHTDAVFRVDANCAWTAEQTLQNAAELAELNVEFIEQPLPADDWDGMKEVHRRSKLPVIADESCQVEADVDRAAGHFHGVNIKLVKCGGLVPARRMIDRARQLGLKVMVGCMTESTVGISAIAQLLPLLDYVDMDGALLLERDIASGVTIEQGRVHYPDETGCGARLLVNGYR